MEFIEFKLLVMGITNGDNASFSVQCKIFPKLKAQISQMRHQNVLEGLSPAVNRKKTENYNLSSCFHQTKMVFFRFFRAYLEFAILHIKS